MRLSRFMCNILNKYNYLNTAIPSTFQIKRYWTLCNANVIYFSRIKNIGENVYSNQQYRSKYSRQKKTKVKDEESDEESDDEAEISDKNCKIITAYLSIPRLDAVIKAGLGIARNKVEILFYENKIRINGFKIPKKSHRVHLGDKIDVIKSIKDEGSSLVVSRIKFTSAKEVEDKEEIKCKFKVYKNLDIENYKEEPYKLN